MLIIYILKHFAHVVIGSNRWQHNLPVGIAHVMGKVSGKILFSIMISIQRSDSSLLLSYHRRSNVGKTPPGSIFETSFWTGPRNGNLSINLCRTIPWRTLASGVILEGVLAGVARLKTVSHLKSIMNRYLSCLLGRKKGRFNGSLSLVEESVKVFLVDTIYPRDASVHLIL